METRRLRAGATVWIPSCYATVIAHDPETDIVKVRHANQTVSVHRRNEIVNAQEHWEEAKKRGG